MRLEELAPVIRRRQPRDEPAPGTLLLDGDDDADAVLAYFAADRSRRVVRLVAGGRPRGYVVRTDVYAFFPARTKGLGDSAGARLPGFPAPSAYRLLTLSCPVTDCPVGSVVTTRYDADSPPRCERHLDQVLRQVS
jgi:hypothetical protein